jgi:acyl carrier protein
MEEALRRAEERFGHIDGVIHSAGVAGGGIIQLKTRAAAEAVLAPKLKGALVLDELMRARRPDFVVLCSSLASVLGGAGQVDYVAANAFLDALARRNTAGYGPFTVSVNWDTWSQVGMAVDTTVPRDLAEARRLSLETGIRPEEGRQAFGRILAQHLPQVLTSVTELDPRLTAVAPHAAADSSGASRAALASPARPDLESEYVAPRNEVERTIAEIWQEFLGFEKVGVHDSFFDLGGHSLLATRLASRLRETFQVALTLQTLFEAPTVAGLAAFIVAKETQPGQAGEIARLLQSVAEMSPAEVRALLTEQSTAGSQV